MLPLHTTPPNDDLICFVEEPPAGDAFDSRQTWKIMLVDDEPSIHQATKVALKFFTFKERSLSFISAYSAEEAKKLIVQHPDTVLILLDVVMGSQDAGLKVAKYIREELHNTTVRIVLRTGQPGQAPEESVIVNYDINDYKTKLELTQAKLFTTVVSSIRAYCDLTALSQSQAALTRANRALAALNHSLEQRVHARTQALTHEVREREKAEESLRLYIHALAHDLRNPVVGMSTVLQTLLNRAFTADSPQAQIPVSVLSRMKAGCDRQLKMIGTLLEAQQAEVWGVALEYQTFDLGAMVLEILEDWQHRLEKKRVSVVTRIAPSLPPVEGDRTQLWRVFENLIDNALKYNPPGITLTLTVELYAADPNVNPNVNPNAKPGLASDTHSDTQTIRCTVQDNGVGIPSQRNSSLFELYQRGASDSPSRGLGLGLYICRCIVEAHRGTIGISSPSSADQSGTEFWLVLPVSQRPLR